MTSKTRMTQSQLFNHFAEKTGLSRAQVKGLFEELANMGSEVVIAQGEFPLPGFGKLVLSERKAREGRNPATGETIQIPAKTALKFRLGKIMKQSALGEPVTRPDYEVPVSRVSVIRKASRTSRVRPVSVETFVTPLSGSFPTQAHKSSTVLTPRTVNASESSA